MREQGGRCSVVTSVAVVCSPVSYYYSHIIRIVSSPSVIKPCNAFTCVS